jgi:hypothetical protein
MGFDWKLFLEKMRDEGILLQADVDYFLDSYCLRWMVHVRSIYERY